VARRGVWLNTARALFYPTMWLASSHRFLGLENIPAEGPALVVGNHVSYIDPLYTAVFLDRAHRLPHFLAKDSVFRLPVIGKLANELEQIPVYRGSAEAVDSLTAAGKSLDNGHIVVIYPEGTITRDPDFWPMRARTGAARLALDHAVDGAVPVIPLVHWNTQLVYDHYHGKKFRPLPRKRVVVSAGGPIDLSTFRGRERTGDLFRQVTDHLMSSVRDVLADLRGEPAPAEFFQVQRRDRG
jgi:1-acyl-sn-glycerol-3-phosphate acyltransferase